MPLVIELRKERTVTVVRASGYVYDSQGSSELLQTFDICIGGGDYRLLLEAHAIQGLDKAGVTTLYDTRLKAKEAGGDLKIAGARYGFIADLALYANERVFTYYVTSEDALASFSEADGDHSNGVRHFDILQFVKEQAAEDQERASEEKAAVPKSDMPK